MNRLFKKLRKNQRGATAIEYGMIVALIGLAALGAIQAFATDAITMWNTVGDESTTHMPHH
jgi:pilus assembly protein Flp/PilA